MPDARKKRAQQVRRTRREPPPTRKQEAFVAAFLDPQLANGCGVCAARIAGYKGNPNVLAVTASRNRKKLKIQRLISAALERSGGTLDCAAVALAGNLSATKRRAFLTDNGLVYAEPEPDYAVRQRSAECIIDFHRRAHETEAKLKDVPKGRSIGARRGRKIVETKNGESELVSIVTFWPSI